MGSGAIRAVVGTFVVVVALLAPGAPASAAVPKAPKGFFGVHVRDLRGGDFQHMEDSDVGIVRTGFAYSTVKSSLAAPENWTIFDNFVAGTADHGMDLLPVVYGTPSWLPGDTGSILDGPVESAWQSYLADLVERYGPGGEFWSLNPEVAYRPIRYWQLWNEPNSTANWDDPNGQDFGRFLARSAGVIHTADPDASVVSAGIVSKPLNPDLQDGAPFLHDVLGLKSARRAIDIVAVHPYAKNTRDARTAIADTRRTLDEAGMQSTPIWVSEIGWGSTTPKGSSGRRPGPTITPAERRWNMTEAKQRENLQRTFEMALKQRRELGIGRMIWYQWQDAPDASCRWCETAGLLDQDGVAKPLLRVFKSLART